MSEIKLKPCLECGADDMIIRHEWSQPHSCFCCECEKEIKMYPNKKDITIVYNERYKKKKSDDEIKKTLPRNVITNNKKETIKNECEWLGRDNYCSSKKNVNIHCKKISAGLCPFL